MLSSSAFIKCAGLIFLLSWLSCASTSPSIKLEERRVIRGEVTVTGDSPFERQIAVVTGSGTTWIVRNPDLEDELVRLGGHDIQVEGVIAKDSDTGPTVLVERYEMMPVAGRSPVIGTLVLDDERLHLDVSGIGEKYLLKGRLREALMHFVGYKVWVWGDESPGEGIGRKAVYLNVEGYGILGPPKRGSNSAASDSLQYFHNR